ncbi:hypothetical protein JAO82_06130 [Pontibaca sp. S1109L]|uniref:Uncharacterized protein n=1 Tax=Pontibaca salina TaxID=2795731 RepID=A0A934M076_9RHOB|nr:hypothetical protein [Pontibaca salina]
MPFYHEELLPEPLPSPVPTVFFDPLIMRDSRFLFQYIGPRYQKMHLIPLPNVGHEVLKPISKNGELSRLMVKILRGKSVKYKIDPLDQ